MVLAMIFDRYTLYARVLPAYIVVCPAGIAFAVIYGSVSLIELLSATTFAPALIAAVLAQIGRDAGYRKQSNLWERWGGPPTTQILRHRASKINPALRARYHDQLRRLLPDINIPSPSDEENDPVAADNIYEVCVRYLISRTRDARKFPLVFRENVNYGFRRNLWALKPFGIVCSSTAMAASVYRLWGYRGDLVSAPPGIVLAAIIGLALLAMWLFVIAPSWVMITAEAYAVRLLEASEQLDVP